MARTVGKAARSIGQHAVTVTDKAPVVIDRLVEVWRIIAPTNPCNTKPPQPPHPKKKKKNTRSATPAQTPALRPGGRAPSGDRLRSSIEASRNPLGFRV